MKNFIIGYLIGGMIASFTTEYLLKYQARRNYDIFTSKIYKQ